jgi:hypothetical protein
VVLIVEDEFLLRMDAADMTAAAGFEVLATSGHIHVGETDPPEGGRFLPKPYSPIEVTGLLRELTSGA